MKKSPRQNKMSPQVRFLSKRIVPYKDNIIKLVTGNILQKPTEEGKVVRWNS